jgi:hypothetical protein
MNAASTTCCPEPNIRVLGDLFKVNASRRMVANVLGDCDRLGGVEVGGSLLTLRARTERKWLIGVHQFLHSVGDVVHPHDVGGDVGRSFGLA